MSDFKIFFSWQSDISKNKTTSFIDECLDSVSTVLKDTIIVKSDRGTQGLTGSPDITEAIFSKIDDCDLFIADLSIVNHFSDKKLNKKLTPNPNVLLETGYAARAIGWDRVICLFNEDFGTPSDYPFDIGHRRLTPFKFTQSVRESEKERISQLIADSVIKLNSSGGIQRRGKAYYKVGYFDYVKKTLTAVVKQYKIREGVFYKEEKQKLITNCKDLIEKIQSIVIPACDDTDILSDPVDKFDLLLNGKQTKKEISIEDIEGIRKSIKEYFDIDVSDDFFYLGQLVEVKGIINDSVNYKGTEQEKQKYKLLNDLNSDLIRLMLVDVFTETFDDFCLIPLAIKNVSSEPDNNVQVNIRIMDDCAEAIKPTKYLFNDEYKTEEGQGGFEGIVCDEGLIESFFKMPTNSYIQYDENEFYKDNSYAKVDIGLGLGVHGSDADDYEDELQLFLKTPVSKGEYQFEISSIRPGEVMWLGPMMVLKAKKKDIKLAYSIISNTTSGDIHGEIVVNTAD